MGIAAGQRVAINGAAVTVANGCDETLADSEKIWCRRNNPDGSLESFLISAIPFFAMRLDEMTGSPYSASSDIDGALNAMIESSRAGMGLPGYRLIDIRSVRLADGALPEGADACAAIRKEEIIEEMRISKRELNYVVLDTPDDLRKVSVVLSDSWEPGLGQSDPGGLDSRADRLFASLVISAP